MNELENHEWKIGEYVLRTNGLYNINRKLGEIELDKVEQITKAGNIKVNGVIYYPSGRERTNANFYVRWIRPITDEEANEFRKKKEEHRYILETKVKIQKCELTYEQALKINAILKYEQAVKINEMLYS